MGNEENGLHLKPRVIWQVIKASGLGPTTIGFVVLFLASAVLIALFEPTVAGFGNAVWFLFQVVTTIGFGDFTVTSLLGRTIVVLLSMYSVFFIAMMTGAVVSYCSERLRMRRNESVALFVDQLEHLPELSHEELVDLSERVKKITKNF